MIYDSLNDTYVDRDGNSFTRESVEGERYTNSQLTASEKKFTNQLNYQMSLETVRNIVK